MADDKIPPDDRRPRTPRDDARLYAPEHEGWTAVIKHDWTKEYCFLQRPGEDYYHLLLSGEIYLQRGTEKYCLACALRHGFASRDRTHWQKEAGATVPVSSDGPLSSEGSPENGQLT
jgi:hypothetical protein